MNFWFDLVIPKQTFDVLSSDLHKLQAIGLLLFLVVLQGCGEGIKKIRVPAVELYHQAYMAYEEKYYQDAEKKFQTLADEHPSTRLATLAYLKMGDLNFERNKSDW